jgi:hypothetical protein
LKITDNAVYCGSFDESRTLTEELEMKALLKMVPGTYKIPSSGGEYEFRMPFCLYLPTGSTVSAPSAIATGKIEATPSNFEELRFWATITQTLESDDGFDWIFQVVMEFSDTADEEDGSFLIDGQELIFGGFASNPFL